MAAPKGNTNNNDGKRWRLAIHDALRRRSKSDRVEALQDVADALIAKALEGDVSALKELGNRIDGMPHQTVEATVDGNITLNIIRFADNNPSE